MHRTLQLSGSCILVLMLLCGGRAHAQGYDDVPGEVVFGISLGGGSAGASIDAPGEVLASTDRDGGLAGNIHFGYELRPDDLTNFVGEVRTVVRERSHGVYVRLPFEVSSAAAVITFTDTSAPCCSNTPSTAQL